MGDDDEPRRIVAAAIRFDGTLYSMARPKRHHHIIQMISSRTAKRPVSGEQGFLLDDGSFVDRREAASIALANGQAKQLRAPPWLFSEDLW